MEIFNPPQIDEMGNATFLSSCSVADIVRYAISCSDIETVKYLIDEEIEACE